MRPSLLASFVFTALVLTPFRGVRAAPLDDAEGLMQARNYAAAIGQLAADALRTAPDPAYARYLRALARHRAKQHDAALTDCDAVPAESAWHRKAVFLKAQCLIELHRHQELHRARESFEVRRHLKLTITPPAETVEPGAESEIKLTATDQQGRPVQAELSLALASQALFAEYPDESEDIGEFLSQGARTGTSYRFQSTAAFEIRAQSHQLHASKDGGAAKSVAAVNPQGLTLLREVEELSKPGSTAVLAVRRYVAESDLSKQEKGRLLIDISRGHGNVGNGHAIYSRLCAACHKVGQQGTEYGPDLSDVGARLKRPEITESILEPNAKIAKGFELTNLTAGDGHALTGFVTAETKTTLTMRIGPGVVQEMNKNDIKKRETIRQSPMPDGLSGTMAPQEFLDLVEFLASQKTAPAK